MKTLLSFITLLLISNFTYAQTTAIPDANFEQALINLGYDTAPTNGSVLTSNISGVFSLIIDSKNISDLTGIEDFTALTYLYCYDNQLTSINVTQNTALEYLQCSDNQLTSIDVTQNTALEYLNCDDNQLTSINVTQNTALVSLDCYDNQLTSLDVTQNTALVNLSCDQNQLTSINVTQNTALTYLFCGDNQLTSIDVTQNTALEYLNCDDNQLTSINVTQNTALVSLDCSGSSLTSLNVTQNTALTSLFCGDNQLTSLDVTQNTALVSLSCDQNQLICLNMKNGNNSNFSSISTTNNPNLTCIEVDDVAYSNANWYWIDAQTSFSTSCPNPCAVGIEENSLQNLSLYPNPSTGSITIDLEETKSNVNLSLTNALGQVVLTQNHKSTNHINFDLDAPKGLYFLRLETDGEVITKKILFN